ncbi:MAG: hypothetical protein WC415_01090 [Patescibacteria group bacterium]|jgi:hypothetical protein
MTYKKITFFLFATVLLISLTGCRGTKIESMDELNAENLYPYSNDDLGFSLYLPSDFIYFQTQRKNNQDFSDLEIYIPTADMSQQKEVSGYAKPIIVRVFDKKYWNDNMNDEERAEYIKAGEKGNRVYGLMFWNNIPSDWSVKWTEDMKNQIIKDFQIK